MPGLIASWNGGGAGRSPPRAEGALAAVAITARARPAIGRPSRGLRMANRARQPRESRVARARTPLATVEACVCAPPRSSASCSRSPSPAPTRDAAIPAIAQGVSAGGVDLSGLTVAPGRPEIEGHATGTRCARSPCASAPALSSDDGGSRDPPQRDRATAQAALHAPPAPTDRRPAVAPSPARSSSSSSPTRTPRSPRSSTRSQQTVSVAPRDATLKIGLATCSPPRQRGSHARRARRRALIDSTIDDDTANRNIHVAVVSVQRPKVNADDIRAQNPTIVTVDRAHFTLRLFKHLKIARRYGIAVGRAGLETPTGIYHVQDKQVNPSWHVPNASWAGLAGRPGHPAGARRPDRRPLDGARQRRRHPRHERAVVDRLGCVARVHSDAGARCDPLFDRVPLGTPVLVG